MYNIEYEIKLNENNRPYIELPDNYDNNSEDRFFTIEITRYILQDIRYRRKDDLNDNTIKYLDNAITLLGQVSDEVAKILFDGMRKMRKMGDIQLMLNPKYHIQVQTIEDRNTLPEENILYNNKIYDRVEGLKVLVVEEMNIYILNNGITNENWKLL